MVAVIFEIISTDSFSLPSINIVGKLKMSNFNCMMISSAGKLLMDTILFCLKLQDIAVHYNTVETVLYRPGQAQYNSNAIS